MAQVIGGFCASHAPGQIVRRSAGGDAADRFIAAQDAAAERLRVLKPDAIVICSGEHFSNYWPDCFPQATIGTGVVHTGPCEPWMNIPRANIPGHAGLGRHIAEWLLNNSFDPTTSDALLLDHGVMTSYLAIDPLLSIPVVPIIQNTLVAPMMPLARCYQMGLKLGEAINAYPEPIKVAVVGAGGLSHWIGTPIDGIIDEQFDRWFLDKVESGNLGDLLNLTDAELYHAGTGAHEVRSWLTAIGAMNATSRRVTAYEPIHAWLTGMAVLEFGATSCD